MRFRPTSFLLLLSVLAVAAYAYWMPFGGARLTIEAPAQFAVLPDKPRHSLPLLLHLDNRSRRALVLDAPSCRPVRWMVLSQASEFVQSQGQPKAARASCVPAPKLALDGGERHSELVMVVLEARRYRLNQNYRVRVQFWGSVAEAQFQLVPSDAR